MARGPGLSPQHMAAMATHWGGIMGVAAVQTAAGTSVYELFSGGAPFALRVTRVRGIMTGNGAAGDTVLVRDEADNAICNTIDVSALSDKDTFEESSIDDLYWDIDKGEDLTVVTASDALAYVMVEFHRRST